VSQHLVGILTNLISALIAATATWWWRSIQDRRLRSKRLKELQKAASEGEVAICIRVGGNADPVPDVLKYLRQYHPNIRQMIAYRISAEDAALDDPETAHRIIETICEGIRAYGKGEKARVHFSRRAC